MMGQSEGKTSFNLKNQNIPPRLFFCQKEGRKEGMPLRGKHIGDQTDTTEDKNVCNCQWQVELNVIWT